MFLYMARWNPMTMLAIGLSEIDRRELDAEDRVLAQAFRAKLIGYTIGVIQNQNRRKTSMRCCTSRR